MDLSFLDTLESLSCTRTLLPESRRRCAALEAEVTAAELAAPLELEAAARDAGAAHMQLAELSERAASLEESLAVQREVSDRLSTIFSGPERSLSRLRQAEMVLSTLADADELARKVSSAAADGDAAGRDAALHRLLLLRLVVVDAAAGAGAAANGMDATSGGASVDMCADVEAADERQVALALAQLVGSRLRSVLPPLRPPCLERLATALKALGWPAVPQAPGAGKTDTEHAGFVTGTRAPPQSSHMHGVAQAMCDALLLQFCAWAADSEGSAAGRGEGSDEDGGGDGARSTWALDALSDPLLRRFRYHFEGRRETNRRDKPEWVFAHCVAQMRAHSPFLRGSIQPLLLSPLTVLERAARSASVRAAVRARYVHFVGLHAGDGAECHVAASLCDAIVAKLVREMQSRLAEPPLFCHTLSEAVACERELRQSLRLPPAASVLRAFTCHPGAMRLWLRTEREDASARLEALMSEPNAWSLSRREPAGGGGASSFGGGAAAGPLPPPCARGVMKLARGLFERISLVAAAEVRGDETGGSAGTDASAPSRLLDEVLLPTLAEFSSQMRSKAAQAMIGTVDWRSVGALLSALLFAEPLLEEWQEEPVLSHLDFSQPGNAITSHLAYAVAASLAPSRAAGAAAALPARARVFERLLASWRHLRQELEEHASATLAADFCQDAARYVAGIRAFRLAEEEEGTAAEVRGGGGAMRRGVESGVGGGHGRAGAAGSLGSNGGAPHGWMEAADRGEITPSLCEPLSLLRSQLSELRSLFPPSSLRRAWRSLAAAVDRWLYENVVRRATFSPAGARQYVRDARATLDSLVGVTAAPHVAMPRVAEAAALLRLSAAARADMQRMVSEGAADALNRRREEEGIHVMSDNEIRELLASVVQ